MSGELKFQEVFREILKLRQLEYFRNFILLRLYIME
jgi:hypothetical protein